MANAYIERDKEKFENATGNVYSRYLRGANNNSSAPRSTNVRVDGFEDSCISAQEFSVSVNPYHQSPVIYTFSTMYDENILSEILSKYSKFAADFCTYYASYDQKAAQELKELCHSWLLHLRDYKYDLQNLSFTVPDPTQLKSFFTSARAANDDSLLKQTYDLIRDGVSVSWAKNIELTEKYNLTPTATNTKDNGRSKQ